METLSPLDSHISIANRCSNRVFQQPQTSKMKAFAVVALASVALAAPNCSQQTVDKCLQKVLPYANRTMLGISPEEVEAECMKDREAIKCLLDYAASGCVKGDTEKALKVIIRGASEESALRCQKGTGRNFDYFQYVPCVNKAGPKLNKCLRDSTGYIEAAARGGVATGLPQSCCAFGRLCECLDEATTAECGEDAAKYVKGVFRGIAGGFIDGFCGAHKPKSPECKSIEILKFGEPKLTTPIGAIFDLLKHETVY